ncbi:bifunctional DNA primase/polymerase [Leptospira paudalimensis]|uniref:Bifunctional DNA primase/polymerase n=1 Tax=Leptospira paudalimensis TaxID=2950024 RepID=A0ABT3M673_9LEPT|nr:bifunctional DNA primase/polymerase [Leptospira paudalimensis]MCW7503885.1 bifunctional DNA primase/polymerase [Leptospira paudalimensis]
MTFQEELTQNGDLSPYIGELAKIKDKLLFVPVKNEAKHHFLANWEASGRFGEGKRVSDLDQGQILEMVEGAEVQNWGLVIGRCENLFVIDIDNYDLTIRKLETLSKISKSFADKYEKYKELISQTYTIKSQSGGRHHYFLFEGVGEYKRSLKKNILVAEHLDGNQNLISEYESIIGGANPSVIDTDFLIGKQLVLLPFSVIEDPITGKRKSYSIENNFEVKKLTIEEFGALLLFFNGVKKKEEKRDRVKKLKEPTPKIKKIKLENSLGSKVAIKLHSRKWYELTDAELETYDREIKFISHLRLLQGWQDNGLVISREFEVLTNKSLSEAELKEGCGGRRTPVECSWIRKLFFFGVSRKSIVKFARDNFNIYTHSYSDPSFIESFYDKLEDGKEVYSGIDMDLYESIQLIHQFDLKRLFGGSQSSCRIVLESLYSLGILNSNYKLKFLSNGILSIASRVVISEKTVRKAFRRLIESEVIHVSYAKKDGKNQYINQVRLLSKDELETKLLELCDKDSRGILTPFTIESRIPLHKLKGVGKTGEEIYLRIKSIGEVKASDIYSILPNITNKNKIKVIKRRVKLLWDYGFLVLNSNATLSVSDKPMSDCVKIIETENIERKRKLISDPIDKQFERLMHVKKSWKVQKKVNKINDLNMEILNRFVVSKEEIIQLRSKLLDLMSNFTQETEYDPYYIFKFDPAEPLFQIHQSLDILKKLPETESVM